MSAISVSANDLLNSYEQSAGDTKLLYYFEWAHVAHMLQAVTRI